eukprot:gene7179-7985_t
MDKGLKSEPVPDRRKICVWTLPEGSPPAVRVEVTTGKITTKALIGVVFKTLDICESSRKFFGLFRGLDPPQKVYGDDEIIYLPCKSVISLQKWSFDPVEEAKAIKTDIASIRLLALQINADVRSRRLLPTLEQQQELAEYLDPEFPCYKQYVENARQIDGYGSIAIKDVKLVSNLKLKEEVVKKGHLVDIVCSERKLVVITDKKELRIPWRKVRRWTQVSDYKLVSFEIYLMEQKAFTWIELETFQAPYLLQVTSEFIAMLKLRVQKPEFKKPAWATKQKRQNRLSWTLFKEEMFGSRRDKDEPELELFDFENGCSSSSEEDDCSMAAINPCSQKALKGNAQKYRE